MNDINQTSLNNLLGGSSTGGSILPSSLGTFLAISMVALTILSFVFIIFYILGSIRKWKVQSAVLRMEKDLSEIKAQLNTNTHNVEKNDLRPVSVTPVNPQASNDID